MCTYVVQSGTTNFAGKDWVALRLVLQDKNGDNHQFFFTDLASFLDSPGGFKCKIDVAEDFGRAEDAVINQYAIKDLKKPGRWSLHPFAPSKPLPIKPN